ncbi:hypothetical protein [Neoroseomonas rubea]|uniref:hypothetical protein n=1 Tax=Neoroseomonas rubea TaxID=2748666 RepID=UPI0018E02489|nr:hypothetical protein [Roseomonas rubea]
MVLVLMRLALASPGVPPLRRRAVILRDSAAAALVPAASRAALRRLPAIDAFGTTGNRMLPAPPLGC